MTPEALIIHPEVHHVLGGTGQYAHGAPLPADIPAEVLLWAMEQILDGRPMAIALDGRRVMWVNENHNNSNLLANACATDIARRNGSVLPDAHISGAAIISGESDEGNPVPLTAAQVERTMQDFAAS
ncbi:hypothetical protein ACFY1V_31865 [Streptomyces sp. NPDC001255]|uniref:DUF3846 domain-containing protein n=1 Tax=Streptomyces sp. NPDC001255 TaxID=3364550 RepID=UPI0036770F27